MTIASGPAPTVLAWLLTYLAHSTLLLSAAWAVTRWAPPRSTRMRERIWKLALFGGLCTASLQAIALPTPWLGHWALAGGERSAAAPPASWDVGGEGALPADAIAAGALPGTPIPASAPDPRRWEATAGSAIPARAAGGPAVRGTPAWHAPGAPPRPARGALELGWIEATSAAWLSLAALGLAGLAVGWTRFLLRLRRRTPLPGQDELARRFAALSRTCGLRRAVRLSTSPSLRVPITFGLVRREVCLPERALAELTPGQLESLLAHELAHARRRDPLWFGLYALVERACILQPLNRLARRELLATAELLCDDQAVRWTGRRLELASCLTEVARWILGTRQELLPAATMAAAGSRLRERVERLLDDRRSPVPERRALWWAPAAALTLAGVSFTAPAVSSRPAPDDAEPRVAPEPVPEPEPEPAAEPAATGTPEPPPLARPALGIRLDGDLLRTELELFDEELHDLSQELASDESLDELSASLAAIDERLRRLRRQRARFGELLERVLPTDPPNPEPEPERPSSETP